MRTTKPRRFQNSSKGTLRLGYVIDGLSVLDAIATVATHSVTVHGTKFDDVPKRSRSSSNR